MTETEEGTHNHLLLNIKRPKTNCPVSRASMLPDALSQPVTKCLIPSRLGSAAFLVLLILSTTASYAHGTTVEHDLHIVHNVDNRSPEIDPFWYVGRGVRPIGRFGKRQSAGGLQPVVKSLELLLNTFRNKESLRSVLAQDDSDWLP
ncbi:prolactin releasing hormone 2 [Paramisgurnus dabryanus]|uniref:prolactin releasing hormone 2 n=1 Tax=Paramisgurnus dabryanus TaxID=90735 RepID=UPI0031F42E1C